MIESKRGCGYRKINGTYLEGIGLAVPCDRLPFNIEPCRVCGQGILFSRGYTWIHWYHYAGFHDDEDHMIHDFENGCSCDVNCPICHPLDTKEIMVTIKDKEEKQIVPVRHGLMWVGKKYYSPESFMEESKKMGISKRIATIPRELEVGKTWILLAHKEAGTKIIDVDTDEEGNKTIDGKKEIKVPAVFYAFRPKRIVKLITPDEANDKDLIDNLKKRGITPLVGITDGKGNVSESFELDEWAKQDTTLGKLKRRIGL